MQISFIHVVLNAGLISQLVLLVLLVFSISSWAIIFAKLRLFRQIKTESFSFIDAFWASNNLSEANVLTVHYPHSPEAAVFSAGFAELQKINRARNRKDKSEQKETLEMQLATMDNLKRSVRKAELCVS